MRVLQRSARSPAGSDPIHDPPSSSICRTARRAASYGAHQMLQPCARSACSTGTVAGAVARKQTLTRAQGSTDTAFISVGDSILSSDEEELIVQPEVESLQPLIAAASDWAELQHVLVSRGTAEALTVEDVVGVLKRAAHLSNRHPALMAGPAGSNARLLARTVVSLCCLILLRDIESLDTVTVSGVLTALGLLAAHGALPTVSSKDAPRELLVACFHLTRRARVASQRGLLGPNQLAGVLRASSLLSPQFVTVDWLDEVERQLRPDVMPDLAPASVAALLGAITQARQGRCKRWQPSPHWLTALQEDVAPRFKTFSGFEMAATFYGLVDLTTTSNPSPGAADPDTVPEKRIASSNSTAMSLGLGPFGFLRTRQRNPDDWRRLLMEQRRIERLQAEYIDAQCEHATLLPDLVEQAHTWESTWREKRAAHAASHSSVSSVSSTDSVSGSMDQWTDPAVDRPGPAPDHTSQDPASAAARVLSSVDFGYNGDSGGESSDGYDALPGPHRNSKGSSEKRTTRTRVVTYSLSPRDLALVLVAKTRLAEDGFAPARPKWFGMLPLEVSRIEQELGLGGEGCDASDDEEF